MPHRHLKNFLLILGACRADAPGRRLQPADLQRTRGRRMDARRNMVIEHVRALGREGQAAAGLGLAPVSPAFYSAAGHIPGVPTSWAVSRLSLVNSTVSIGAKTMMGALSQGVGLSLAFFFPIALAVGSGLIAASYAKRARRSELDAAAPPTGPISIIIKPTGP